MNMDTLIKKARQRMGATKAIRLADAKERSRIFNEHADRDLALQQMTPELLAKRCTLCTEYRSINNKLITI